MKYSILFLVAFTALSAGVSHADDTAYPSGPFSAFECPPEGNLAAGTVCYQGQYYGQTLSDRPVQANIAVQLLANTQDTNSNVDRIVRVTIQRITDPTDTYDTLGSIPVSVIAYVCSYHRQCSWSNQSASLVMNRTYGQRYFESTQSFDMHIVGNGGAEFTQILTSLDIWLPEQQYPITVKLAN